MPTGHRRQIYPSAGPVKNTKGKRSGHRESIFSPKTGPGVSGDQQIFCRMEAGCNWYDDSQGTFNFCWAASATNVIHWWPDRNADSADRYFQFKNTPKSDFSYLGKGSSNIYSIFVKEWTENKGGHTNIGFNWFVNVDNNEAIQVSVPGQAAYFKDVFGDTLLNKTIGGPKRRKFNEFIVNSLDNNRFITIGE